ncbi:MAG: hypothetical protein QOG13_874 [Sphingomonadales bacterium]|jgi:hypothetical protein|nr:hypothetical protein [Sphingomonadales bacterium]MEA3044855.1 hypothetical protein [Sphingomonadales bacterium]
MPSAAILFRSAAVAGLLALAACNGAGDNNLAELDNSLIGNGADPALTSALEDQILVDPNLVQQSNPNAARPPETPVQAQYPAGAGGAGGGGAREAAAGGGAADAQGRSACGVPFDYGNGWANRLPADFPAYPGWRVTEAAGSDRGDCHVRVVTFATNDPYNRVLEHYRSLAARAGFSAEQQARGADQVLGGTKGEAAYYLIVTPSRAGSDVALIVNNGR